MLPTFIEAVDLINSVVSTDTCIVAHFCETTKSITGLTKNLNYLGHLQENTSLLVGGQELQPVLGQTGLPSGVDVFSNYTMEVEVGSSPQACFDGGAELVKQYYVTGDLHPG